MGCGFFWLLVDFFFFLFRDKQGLSFGPLSNLQNSLCSIYQQHPKPFMPVAENM